MFRRFVSIERRGLTTEKRADAEAEGLPAIRGTAAVFFDEGDRAGTQYELWPGHVERLMASAFDQIADDDVRCLQNHDSRLLLGRSLAGTLQLNVREHGLDYIVATANTTAGRDTIESLERGDLTGSSFQFLPRSGGYEWSEEDHEGVTVYVRNLTSLQTFDVGPVTFPAYLATSSGVGRSSLCLSDCRSMEARSEMESLKTEVEEFIRQQNYASEAAAKVEELNHRFRMAQHSIA